ncbi:DUF742 domain-containing protein [Streptomyces sp. RKND-216]|uniref:DUF742 domain-containing protein n=1 Tax=Streptomyces sp. RKND-216 TaxID=2562581 RepID=UPI00109D90C7|nr:DUF742 domain-containing protein [Streptomyces sp. RKND-216]THA23465.1 DUF742 domain-containing protein [Streptomyces sp. RKND-216]
MSERWFDEAAGPVVRPYAMTRGRTRCSPEAARLDLIALVIARTAGTGAGSRHEDDLHDPALTPEHVDIVRMCRRSPLSVAELATDLDVPVGIVRVLVGDLLDAGLVRVSRPVPPAELPDENILREVINGLRAL